MTKFTFETLIDDSFAAMTKIEHLKTIFNKRLLSFINDFEDEKWRFSKFQNYLWDNIAETALSARERQSLADKGHTLLIEAAKNLRLTDNDKIGSGSEIAEVFLYGVMKHHFKALPVVPKIFYKQNSQDNAKGADSVHIVVNGNDFTLWFGEAKFYSSIADARLDSIVDSVEKLLKTDKLRKENSIITSVTDIEDLDIEDGLRDQIISSLSHRESIDTIKSRINVPIMLLHECDITGVQTIYNDCYKNDLIAFYENRANSYYQKQILKFGGITKYEEIRFHLILFPVPKKDTIVKRFLQNVSFYKEQVDEDV